AEGERAGRRGDRGPEGPRARRGSGTSSSRSALGLFMGRKSAFEESLRPSRLLPFPPSEASPTKLPQNVQLRELEHERARHAVGEDDDRAGRVAVARDLQHLALPELGVAHAAARAESRIVLVQVLV